MGGRTGLLACLPESSFALPSPQYLFPHRDTANEIEIDGVAEAGFVAQRDGAVRGGFYGGLDDVLFPVAPAGGDVAGQHEIRQAGQGDIVGAPDAGLQHAAAPDRDAGGLGDIVHPFGLAESKPNAGPQSGAADPAKARQLLARAQQAVGGAEKLAAVQDMLEVAELHVDPSLGGVTMKRTDRWVAPAYFREDTQLPFGIVSIYGDGKTGWMSSPQGQAPVPPAQLKAVQDKLLRLFFPMLLSDRLPGRTVNWIGEGALEISDGHGSTVRLFVDEKTGMPAKVEYASATLNGPLSAIDETYDSFEEVDGIKVPNRMTIIQKGSKYADVVVESIQLNTGLKSEDLSKKP